MKTLTLPVLAIISLFSFKTWAGGGIQPIDNDSPIIVLEEPASNSSNQNLNEEVEIVIVPEQPAELAVKPKTVAKQPAQQQPVEQKKQPVNDENTYVVTPLSTDSEIAKAELMGKKIVRPAHKGVFDKDKEAVLDSQENPVISPLWMSKTK